MDSKDLVYYFNVEYKNALVSCGTEVSQQLDINNEKFKKMDFVRLSEQKVVDNTDIVYRYINETKSIPEEKIDLELTNNVNVVFAAYTIPSRAKGRKNKSTFYYRLGMDHSKINFNPGYLINNPYLIKLYNDISMVADDKAKIQEIIQNSTWVDAIINNEKDNTSTIYFKDACLSNWISNDEQYLRIAREAIDILIDTKFKKTLVFHFSNEENTNIIQTILILLPVALAKRISFNTCMDPNDFDCASKYLLCGFSNKSSDEAFNKLKLDERFELYKERDLRNYYPQELNTQNIKFDMIPQEFDENIPLKLIPVNLDCLMRNNCFNNDSYNKMRFIETIFEHYYKEEMSIKSIHKLIDEDIENLFCKGNYQSIVKLMQSRNSNDILDYISSNLHLLGNLIANLLSIYCIHNLNDFQKKDIKNYMYNISLSKLESIAKFNDESQKIVDLLHSYFKDNNYDNKTDREKENDADLMKIFVPFLIFRFNQIKLQLPNEENNKISDIFSILAGNFIGSGSFKKMFKSTFYVDLIKMNSEYQYDYLKLLFKNENGEIFTQFRQEICVDIYSEIQDIISKSENKENNIIFYNHLIEQYCNTDWIEDYLVKDIISIEEIITMSKQSKSKVPNKILHKKTTKYLINHLDEITISNYKELKRIYSDFDEYEGLTDSDNEIDNRLNEFAELTGKIDESYHIFSMTEVEMSNQFDDILHIILGKEINRNVKKKEIVSDAKSVTRNHFITFIICYIISVLLILVMIIPARKFWYCFSFFTIISGLVALISFKKTKGFSIVDARKYSLISQLLMVIIPEIIVNISLYLLYFLL